MTLPESTGTNERGRQDEHLIQEAFAEAKTRQELERQKEERETERKKKWRERKHAFVSFIQFLLLLLVFLATVAFGAIAYVRGKRGESIVPENLSRNLSELRNKLGIAGDPPDGENREKLPTRDSTTSDEKISKLRSEIAVEFAKIRSEMRKDRNEIRQALAKRHLEQKTAETEPVVKILDAQAVEFREMLESFKKGRTSEIESSN